MTGASAVDLPGRPTDQPGTANGASSEAVPPPADPPSVDERWSAPRPFVLPGVWGGLLLAWASFTPSLLPRGPITQGIIAGISAAIGYGVGVLVAFIWRALVDREARNGGRSLWIVTGLLGAVGTGMALILGRIAQGRILGLMGATADPGWRVALTLILGIGVFLVLLLAARSVRWVGRRLASVLSRRLGSRAAVVLAWSMVALGVSSLVSGVLVDGFVAAADRAFSVRDTTTADGVEPTTSTVRSGGPGSLIEWDTLGRQGRTFVSGGPDLEELAAFALGRVQEPVRVYAGMATASDVEERAQRAVDDLERAGGFDRSHLMVATTTGTGWLDPGTMAAFEYLAEGDSAIITMQYSYLPSWLSYLVDQVRARQAGRELFDAVYERWSALPADDRPELFVFGESLGSYGAEAAFSGEFDLRNRTSGALFVGPPGFNRLHREFTYGRDPGSPQITPVYRDGRTVRFSDGTVDSVARLDAPWEGARVLYIQHPSDPIVWWDTDLILRRPDWLAEPRGRDVLDSMRWIPFVTFWQVTGDLPFAVDAPDGHGHRYNLASVDAWAALLEPPGWTQARADRLRRLVAR
ncbi:MAG: alpha/beta hydrolase [Nitriliruptoraceae bacterium]